MSLRTRQIVEVERGRGSQLLVDDLVAEIDALVADVDAGPRDQFLDLALAFATKAAEQLLVPVGRSGHVSPFTPISRFRLRVLRLTVRDHSIDEAVLARLFRGHEVVAIHVLRDLFDLLAGVAGHDLLELALEAIVSLA